MKRIGYTFIFITALGLAACNNLVKPTDPTTVTTPFANVPDVVVKAVRTAYPGASELTFSELDKGKVWESRFKVASVGHQAMVNEKGAILQAYSVKEAAAGMPADTIAPAITAYIRTAYPDYTVVASGAGQFNNQNSFKVLLRRDTQEVTLIFDEKGAVLFEYKSTAQNGTSEPPKTYPINQDELPGSIGQYLKENGLTFGKGLVTIYTDSPKLYLIVAYKGNVVFELTFDAGGKFLTIKASTPTPVSTIVQKTIASDSELPAVITTYLNENYKGWVFMKGYVNSESGKLVEYMVVVQVGGSYWYLYFNGEGKFVTAKKG